MRRKFLNLLAVLAFLPVAAAAQGVQTGTLTGTVKSMDGIAIADAAVVVTSPALQGERTAVTDVNGVYSLPSLPPGTYTVRFAKEGLSPTERSAPLPLGVTASVDAMLSVAQVTETVLVEGVIPPAVTATQTSANITASEVNVLPMGRTPYFIAELMPGLTTNTPNRDQLTISGGFAYDNVFLVDGVDVNDNLIGSMNDLYIEDAVGEVQVLTSGVTAEYGRFSGGVVNVITKSGSNMFAGSYRTTFTRPSWSKETPFESANNIERGKPTPANPYLNNKLSHFSEFTGGGPLAKDRVWFFAAGRFENSSTFGTMPATAVPYTKSNDSKRYEGKLTGSLRQGHTLQGSFIDNRVHRANEPVLSFSIDKAALISPSVPNRLGVVNYNAAVSQRMLVSAQYSQKDWATEGVGGTSSNILDSPFLTRTGTQYQYNAPYFDASDPEQRNNRQLTASVTYFASNHRLGSHELKGGFESFVDQRVGANAQSSTGYVFMADVRLRGRRAGSGCRRPSDSAVRPGHDTRAALDPASRRRVQRNDDVGVCAGSLGGLAAAHAEPRHAIRARSKRRNDRAEVARSRPCRSATRSSLRRQRQRRYGAAGHVLAVLGQVQRRAVLTQHQRRQLGPLHDGVRRAGRRRTLVRARLRHEQLRRCRRWNVSGLERAVRRRSVVTADDRIHVRRGAHVRRPQLCEGGLRAAQDVELHRRVHPVLQRPDAHRRQWRDAWDNSTTSCTTTATR